MLADLVCSLDPIIGFFEQKRCADLEEHVLRGTAHQVMHNLEVRIQQASRAVEGAAWKSMAIAPCTFASPGKCIRRHEPDAPKLKSNVSR